LSGHELQQYKLHAGLTIPNYDNGNETTATWRELEDNGDPTTGTSHYEYSGAGTTYSLTFSLEGSVGNLGTGEHTANESGIQ